MVLSSFPRRAVACLPLSVLALALGCDPPPPEVKNPSLLLTVAKNSADIGETIAVTFSSRTAERKPDTADVVASLLLDDGDVPGSLGLDADTLGAETLTITPDAKGDGAFVFGCNTEGKVTLNLTAGDLTKTEELRCRLPDLKIELDVDPFGNCPTLQADGSSSCTVLVDVVQIDEEGVRAPAAQFPVTAKVDGLTNIFTPDPNLSNGSDDVLAENGVSNGQDSLQGLRTDDNGRVTFLVISPAFNLEETIAFTVSAGGESSSKSVTIRPFVDGSDVDVAVEPARITSGDTAQIRLSAVDADATVADGKVVRVTLPPASGLTVTPEPGVVEVAGDLITVTLNENGVGEVEILAPIVIALQEFTLIAEFQAISDSAVRTATTSVFVDVAGAVTPNVSLDRARIDADGEPQLKAVLTLTAKQGTENFNGVTASVRVAQASRAAIAFSGAVAGTENGLVDEDPVTHRSDAAVFAAFVAGTATVDIVADGPNARGVGNVEVEMQKDGVVILSEVLQITVDRDPVLQSIVYLGSQPANGVIGVQGSSLQTAAILTFKLLDDANLPISGLAVAFVENASDPEVTVDGGLASGADGVITAILNAGHVSGPVTVTATATFGERTLSAASLPIAIVAAVPNSATSFLLCNATAQFDPFAASCSLTLADRFTNRVDQVAINVQFRAEAGNISAVATTAGGVGTATFAFAEPGPGSADVTSWSYSPLTTVPSAQRNLIPGCFDNTTRTPCNLIAMCESIDPLLAALCPLPPLTPGAALGTCLEGISTTARETFADQGLPGTDTAILYEIEALTALDSVPGFDVDQQVAAYQAEHRACGFPLSCLVGANFGLFFDASDDCPVNAGCLDYSSATECPQNGLIDILASVNGEEAFDDLNGNGVRDANEDFVDYPEPFLDKNSNCTFDDLNDNPRLQPIDKIRLSDLFIDDDREDGTFGFGAEGAETNGTHDLSTEISFKTTILHLNGERQLQFGERVNPLLDCGPDLGTPVACSAASGGGFSRCVETALGEVFSPECRPGNGLRDGDSASYVFRWIDSNGNCPSVDFLDSPKVRDIGLVSLNPVADEAPLDKESCGVSPGAIGTKNATRPWCEEHAGMGSELRSVSITVDCGGLEGLQDVALTFDVGLAGTSVGGIEERDVDFTVNCPVCGDGRVEGREECDNGDDVGCDDCIEDEGFTCDAASPSVCTADPPAAP